MELDLDSNFTKPQAVTYIILIITPIKYLFNYLHQFHHTKKGMEWNGITN